MLLLILLAFLVVTMLACWYLGVRITLLSLLEQGRLSLICPLLFW